VKTSSSEKVNRFLSASLLSTAQDSDNCQRKATISCRQTETVSPLEQDDVTVEFRYQSHYLVSSGSAPFLIISLILTSLPSTHALKHEL